MTGWWFLQNVHHNTNSTNSKDCSIIGKHGWNGIARMTSKWLICCLSFAIFLILMTKDRQTWHFNHKSEEFANVNFSLFVFHPLAKLDPLLYSTCRSILLTSALLYCSSSNKESAKYTYSWYLVTMVLRSYLSWLQCSLADNKKLAWN